MNLDFAKPTMFSKSRQNSRTKYVLGETEKNLTDIWYFEVQSALYMQHHYFPNLKVFEVCDGFIKEYEQE